MLLRLKTSQFPFALIIYRHTSYMHTDIQAHIQCERTTTKKMLFSDESSNNSNEMKKKFSKNKK